MILPAIKAHTFSGDKSDICFITFVLNFVLVIHKNIFLIDKCLNGNWTPSIMSHLLHIRGFFLIKLVIYVSF